MAEAEETSPVNQMIIEELTHFEDRRIENLRYVMYLPTYMGIKIKTLNALDFDELSANLSLSLNIFIKLKGLNPVLTKQIVESLSLQMRRN